MYPGESRLKKRDAWGIEWSHCCPLTGIGSTLEICHPCNGVALQGVCIQTYLIKVGEPYDPDGGNFQTWDTFGCKHHARLHRDEDKNPIEGPGWFSPFAANVTLPLLLRTQ